MYRSAGGIYNGDEYLRPTDYTEDVPNVCLPGPVAVEIQLREHFGLPSVDVGRGEQSVALDRAVRPPEVLRMGAAEWDQVKAAVPVGAEVSGRVVACQPFGVFVDLGLGFPGLLEVLEFADPAAQSRGEESFPAVGASVTAWVLQHVDHNRQLRLTQRRLSAEQWEPIRGWLRG